MFQPIAENVFSAVVVESNTVAISYNPLFSFLALGWKDVHLCPPMASFPNTFRMLIRWTCRALAFSHVHHVHLIGAGMAARGGPSAAPAVRFDRAPWRRFSGLSVRW